RGLERAHRTIPGGLRGRLRGRRADHAGGPGRGRAQRQRAARAASRPGGLTPGLALAPDAAMVLGIASTAMPFARTREEEAERWLRVLRLHGEVGIALQA